MHFLVHVILPKDVGTAPTARQVDAAVERLLEPFGNFDGHENDDGWWDWYELGGRFAGAVEPAQPLPAPAPSGLLARLFPLKTPANVASAADVLARWSAERAPFVVVTPDGKAHGPEDWSKEDYGPWEARFKQLLAQHSDHLVAGVDCHN
jgi:hypothetical protein